MRRDMGHKRENGRISSGTEFNIFIWGAICKVVLSFGALLCLLYACASSSPLSSIWPREQRIYHWQDYSGTFYWRREIGQDKKGHLTSKSLLYSPNLGPQQPVEKAIIFSEIGHIKGRSVLRPWRAQYHVWLEGQEYFVEQRLDLAQRKMLLKLRSPREAWNGDQEVAFPPGKVFCYVGQLTECLKGQGFLLPAIGQRAGRLNLYLIWEGYPYVQEQYPALAQLFTPAVVEYDGELGPGLLRFSVSFAGQAFFLVVNERGQLQKFFWVAQGISAEALDGFEQQAAARQQALIDPSPSSPVATEAINLSNPVAPPVVSSPTATAVRKLRWVGNPADGNLGPSGRWP